MKKQINDLLLKMQNGENCIGETANQLLDLFAVMQRSEQLIGFLKDYQKSCELLHVNKIDAKNFVEHWKTN